MVVQLHGVLAGKRIDLESDSGLPAGSRVLVSIELEPPSIDDKRQLVDMLCGAWAGDASIGPIFAEIEERRAASAAREFDFDATS